MRMPLRSTVCACNDPVNEEIFEVIEQSLYGSVVPGSITCDKLRMNSESNFVQIRLMQKRMCSIYFVTKKNVLENRSGQ